MSVHHISPDALIEALDQASSYLASEVEPFHVFTLEHWVREWLPEFVIGVMDQ